jgi:hypothetical protein
MAGLSNRRAGAASIREMIFRRAEAGKANVAAVPGSITYFASAAISAAVSARL